MSDYIDEPFVSRTALDGEIRAEFEKRVLDPEDCVRFTLVRHQGVGPAKESLRPVTISGKMVWQLEQTNGKQIMVKNYAPKEEAEEALACLLDATGAREYHLTAAKGDLHVRITRKGKLLLARGKAKEDAATPAPKSHDHEKQQPLTAFDSKALLRVLGLSDGNGNVKATMRGKTDQINAFLRELDALLEEETLNKEEAFHIVDCGCGRAYLTLAAYCYLTMAKGMKVTMTGIDRNEAVIKRAKEMAESLGLGGSVSFINEDLATCELAVRPNLVLSLHACDIATDLAIACGIRLGAEYMLIAPCCQHDLQKQIKDQGPMRALLRHSILRERLADLLTDAFRAQIMRIVGYRVKVSEFVSSEATARNIMLRGVKGVKKGQPQVTGEYLDMKEEWRVVPALETILGERLTKFFR